MSRTITAQRDNEIEVARDLMKKKNKLINFHRKKNTNFTIQRLKKH